MTYNSVRETVLKALSNVGIFIENSDDDLDLRDFITDSIEFISFIVELENTLDIEIHDDLLQIEAVASLNVFCYRILNILQEGQ